MDKLRIAVCDDEIVQQKLIQALLQKYLTENNILAEVKFYTSGQEYLKEKKERNTGNGYLSVGHFYAGDEWNRHR